MNQGEFEGELPRDPKVREGGGGGKPTLPFHRTVLIRIVFDVFEIRNFSTFFLGGVCFSILMPRFS